MTVIVAALTKAHDVVMAADSRISWGESKEDESFNKLWPVQKNGFVIGAAGSVRASQVIRYWAEWPDIDLYGGPSDMERFAVREIVPAIKMVLSDHGCMTVDDETKESEWGGEMMLAHGKTMVVISSKFEALVPLNNRFAIGSGAPEALGFLGPLGPWTRKDIIEAAKRPFSTINSVGGKVYVMSTKSMEIEEG